MTGNMLVAIGLMVAVYFLPIIVASSRGHHQAFAIFMLNLLLGWTLLGWVAALIWSVSATSRKVAEDIRPEPVETPRADPPRLRSFNFCSGYTESTAPVATGGVYSRGDHGAPLGADVKSAP